MLWKVRTRALTIELLILLFTTMDNQESVPSRSVTFTKGNKGGQQCHLEGYIYTYEKTSKNGNRQWRCKRFFLQ